MMYSTEKSDSDAKGSPFGNDEVKFEPCASLPACGDGDALLVLGPGRRILLPPGFDLEKKGLPLATRGDWDSLGLRPENILPAGILGGKPVHGIYLDAAETAIAEHSGVVTIDVRKYYQASGILNFELLNRVLHGGQWHRASTKCPVCGADTRWKPDEFAKECSSCGFVQYPRINPAVIMAVLDGDHILLARNAQASFPFWSLLAGYVEIGENLEQTVVREVFEESGLAVDQVEYVGSQAWAFSESLMVGYTCRLAPGVKRSDLNIDRNEIAEAAWFPLGNLPEYAPYPSMAWRIIDHVLGALK